MSLTVVLIVLLMTTVLTAGCGGWNGGSIEREQDVRITKLNSDGLTEWTTLIDTGNYDFGLDFTETPDGGFVVVGGTTKLACMNYPAAPDSPRLTRLSASGETLWTRDYDLQIVKIIPDGDGKMTALVKNGRILQLDSNGTITWFTRRQSVRILRANGSISTRLPS